jgi:hypothetical protein
MEDFEEDMREMKAERWRHKAVDREERVSREGGQGCERAVDESKDTMEIGF